MKPLPDNISEPFKKLLAVRDEMRNSFPGLSFSLHEDLTKQIGKAIAVSEFKLETFPAESFFSDESFKAPNGTIVKIRITQRLGGKVYLKLEPLEHLLVIQLSESGTYSILYDGPSSYIDKGSSGQMFALSIFHLHQLNQKVRPEERLCGC